MDSFNWGRGMASELALFGYGVCIAAVVYAAALRSQLKAKAGDNTRLNKRLEETTTAASSLKEELHLANVALVNLRSEASGLRSLIQEKFKLFPWLKSAKQELEDVLAKRAAALLIVKKHPALKAAEQVREYREKAKAAEQTLHRIRYRQEYCEYLFPWLADLFDEDIATLMTAVKREQETAIEGEHDQDPVRGFLAKEEYEALADAERNQRALDRFISNRKTNWQIGREFERFVGYCMEQDGFDVESLAQLKAMMILVATSLPLATRKLWLFNASTGHQ
jgi:hypothetical protein